MTSLQVPSILALLLLAASHLTPDAILVFCKLYEIIDGLAVLGEEK